MNQFLPQNYEIPKGKSNYMKFEKEKNKFRVVSSAVIGYEYWNKDNKPVRLKEYPENLPHDIRKNDNGTPTEIKHFWAFAVIDRYDNSIKLLEVTQKGIMREIQNLVSNEDWGLPQGYDINVIREGDGLDTKYTVQPTPHKELTADEQNIIKNNPVNLEALFTGGDPFEVIVEEKKFTSTDDFDVEIPYVGF